MSPRDLRLFCSTHPESRLPHRRFEGGSVMIASVFETSTLHLDLPTSPRHERRATHFSHIGPVTGSHSGKLGAYRRRFGSECSKGSCPDCRRSAPSTSLRSVNA